MSYMTYFLSVKVSEVFFMAQHFLLSADARDFSLLDIATITERKAETIFRKLRWSDTLGHPVCPKCGGLEHYDLSSRKVWKCKYCSKQFSVTSGTLFSGHKLPHKTILLALAIFSNAVKGLSALQMARDLNVQYKTAYVLLQKFREALLESRDESQMDGVCEIDGAYFNSHMRPANNIDDRVDRRLSENQNPKKRCVMTVRKRGDVGSVKTLTFVTKGETVSAVSNIARKYIKRGSTIHTDEANAYDPLHAYYKMMRVNHSREYFSKDGACSNQAESYFARLRRMEYGQYHRIGGKYLYLYANEAAYREDSRRESNGRIMQDLTKRCITSEQSSEWTGYWQGNHPISERLVA